MKTNSTKKPKGLLSILYIFLLLLIVVIGFNPFLFNSSESNTSLLVASPLGSEVKTSSGALISRVAPGEFLPVSVKLINFGSGRRVDVTIHYRILRSDNTEVLRESETVAVETSSNFVKILQIPRDLSPGQYVVASSIIYAGQEVPATSQFQFDVERKIAGIFVSQFILYGIITLAIAIAFAVVSRLIIKKNRSSRFTPHDYSNIPKHDRLFYEMISDTIMQIRNRVGDRAIELTSDIDGLTVDENTGKVLKLTKNPAKIIALIVLRYENHLGSKISFALRRTDDGTEKHLKPVFKI